MKKDDFIDMENIRKSLKIKQLDLIVQKNKLEESYETEQISLSPLLKDMSITIGNMERDLKFKRMDISKDKELRNNSGFSNQKDWGIFIESDLLEFDKKEIERVRKVLQEEIDEVKETYKDLRNDYKDTISKLEIDIENIRWKLKIRHVYHFTNGNEIEVNDINI